MLLKNQTNKLVLSLKNTIASIKEFWINVGKRPQYYLPTLICVFVAYSFSLSNRTVSIDDMAQHWYYGEMGLKIQGLRWGELLINTLFSIERYTPFLDRFIGLICFVISSFFICVCLYSFDRNKRSIWKYGIFSSIFVTYPLINEMWDYYLPLFVGVEFVVVTFVILHQYVNKKYSVSNIIFSGILLSIIVAGYESLVFVYIALVFVILFNQYILNDCKDNNWIKEGFSYALPLFVAMILKFVVGYALIFVTNTNYFANGDSEINWLRIGFKESLIKVLYNAYYYVVRGLSYMPITEFVIGLIIFVFVTIKYQIKGKKWSIAIAFFLLISLFGLSILQGMRLNYRAAQTIQLFVPYTFYLMLSELESSNKVLTYIVTCLLVFVGFRQSVMLHQIIALNNQRSNNEAVLVQQIGYELYSKYDMDKLVVFCGEYQLGDFIESQISIKEGSLAYKAEIAIRKLTGHTERYERTEFVDTDVNSVLNWSKRAFFSQTMMKELFSYYGYDIKTMDSIPQNWKQFLGEYEKIAEEKDMGTYSISDMGDYILVYLGPVSNNIDE